MRKDIFYFVSKCQACIEHSPVTNLEAPILPYPIPKLRWETVVIDILQLQQTERGYKYVLVIIDCYSRFTELVCLQDKSAKTVVRALFDHLLCRHGAPKVLLSDNGGEFNNALLDKKM
jgi:transposase InsO family protein